MVAIDGIDPDAEGSKMDEPSNASEHGAGGGGGESESESVSKGSSTSIWSRVDWSLLLFFSALFIVVSALTASGWPNEAWSATEDHIGTLNDAASISLYVVLIIIGSNTVSNVPLVLLLAPHLRSLPIAIQPRAWLLLAYVSTVAGNLTLLASVANLIVAQRARPWVNLSFVKYAKFGSWSTILLIALGVLIIQAMRV